MTAYLLAAVMTLALMTSIAAAQTAPPDNAVPSVVAPPEGTLSTSRTRHVIDGNGTETNSSQTTYRNEAGVADDSRSTTTTHPAPGPTTTTSSSSSSSTMTR